MATKPTEGQQLVFEAKGLSPFGGHSQYTTYWDTDILIKEGTPDFDVGDHHIWAEYKIGFLPYAVFPGDPSFDATFRAEVDAVIGNANLDTDSTATFDISGFSKVVSSVTSRSFSAAAEAGIKLVFEFGIGDGARHTLEHPHPENYWFDPIKPEPITLFALKGALGTGANYLAGNIRGLNATDKDKIDDMFNSLPEASKTKPQSGKKSFLDALDGVDFYMTLPPTNQQDEDAFDSYGVSVENKGDNFVGVKADLDKILTSVLKALPPPLTGIGITLENTVFAEKELQVGPLSIAKFTVMDLTADVGLSFSEITTLDFNGRFDDATDNGAPPDLTVTIQAFDDEGQAMSDEKTTTVAELMKTGNDSFAALKLYDPVTKGQLEGTGEATIKATYSMPNVTGKYDFGLSLNFQLQLAMLQGSVLGIDLVSGPTIKLPDPSLTLFRWSLKEWDINIPGSEFGTQTAEYKVFYTDDLPTGVDINDPLVAELVDWNVKRIEAQKLQSESGYKTPDYLWIDNVRNGENRQITGELNIGQTFDDNFQPTDEFSAVSYSFWLRDRFDNHTVPGTTVVRAHPGQRETVSQSEIWHPNYYVVRSDNPYNPLAQNGNFNVYIIDGDGNSIRSASATPSSEWKAILDMLGQISDPAHLASAQYGLRFEGRGADSRTMLEIYNEVSIIGGAKADILVHYAPDWEKRGLSPAETPPKANENDSGSGHYYDGGDPNGNRLNPDNYDVLIADFGASNPTASFYWDMNEAFMAAAPNSLDSGFRRIDIPANPDDHTEGIVVGRIEQVVLRLGSGNDTIVLWRGEDYLDTAGGHDQVHLRADSRNDEVLLGRGDDYVETDLEPTGPSYPGHDLIEVKYELNQEIVGWENAFSGLYPVRARDKISGQGGRDTALHWSGFENDLTLADFADMRTDLEAVLGPLSEAYDEDRDNGLQLRFGTASVTAASRTDDLGALRTAYASYIGATTLSAMSSAMSAGSAPSISYFRDDVLFDYNDTDGGPGTLVMRYEVIFDATVEHVVVNAGHSGGDASRFSGDDVVLFTGWGKDLLAYYEGGAGDDTLIADFGAIAKLLGEKNGVVIGPGRSLWGLAEFGGFERFNLVGTDKADVMVGGGLARGKGGDYLDGGAGNDDLWGGDDDNSDADVLKGGAGDDILRWSNNGEDRMFGGTDGKFGDTLVIRADGKEQAGLNWYLPSSIMGLMSLTATRASASSEALKTAWDYPLDVDTQFKTFGVSFTDIAPFPGEDENLNTVATFEEIEHVDIFGSNAKSDLVLYLNGSVYDGGESEGDADVFVADFSAFDHGINFSIAGIGPFGQMEGGVTVRGMERAILKTTASDDNLIGGALDDWFETGDGDDLLDMGKGRDVALAGDGKDTVKWTAAANGPGFSKKTILDGGAGVDTLAIKVEDGALGIEGLNHGAGAWQYFIGQPRSNDQMIALLDDIRANPGMALGVGTQSSMASVTGFEAVSIAGSDAYDDLILWMGGGTYLGGEREGDNDRFVGDFRDQSEQVYLGRSDHFANSWTGQFTTAYTIGADVIPGSILSGFESYFLLLGATDDVVFGNGGADYIDGGDGNDTLMSGGFFGTGNTALDVLKGGAGDDRLIVEGSNAEVDGGTGFDKIEFHYHSSTGEGAALSAWYKVDGLGYTLRAATQSASDWSNISGEYYTLKEKLAGSTDADGRNLSFGYHGGVEVTYSGVESVRLSSYKDNRDHSADRDVTLMSGLKGGLIVGGNGNDTLYALGSGSTLSGVGGFDTYVIAHTASDVTIVMEGRNGGQIFVYEQNVSDITATRSGMDVVMHHAYGTVTIQGFFIGDSGDHNGMTVVARGGTKAIADLLVADASQSALARTEDDPTDARSDPFDIRQEHGTDGDDLMHGSAGRDVLHGGAGDDVLMGSGGLDLFDGGAGEDVVNFELMGDANSLTIVDLGTGVGTGGAAEGDHFSSIEHVIGTWLGRNWLTGDEANNALTGGGDDDVLKGAGGSDYLLGLAGNDTLDGGDGDDRVFGDLGTDYLKGGEGNDLLDGGEDDDKLYGENGHDAMIGGAGSDEATGGDGDDVYYHGGHDIAGTEADENGNDTFDGGEGVDTIDLADYEQRVWFTSQIGQALVAEVKDGGAVARRVLTASNVEKVIGTHLSDVVLDAAGAHVFDLGLGNDVVKIADGNTGGIYFGGLGFDMLFSVETATQGIIVDLNAADAVAGTSGTFTDGTGVVSRIHGFDLFEGTRFRDIFHGDDSESVFEDGMGRDLFNGGGGDDLLMAGVSRRRFDDRYDGGEGVDGIDYSAARSDILVDLSKGLARDLSTGKAGIGRDVVKNFEHVLTGAGNDRLLGSRADEFLEAGNGNDVVVGGLGNDRIYGGRGNDKIDGDNGKLDKKGFDIADYSGVSGRLVFDMTKLVTNVTSTRQDWTDKLSRIEAVAGGLGNDLFKGGRKADTVIYAHEAGQGGFDVLRLGAGQDTADFSEFQAAIHVDLKRAVEVTTNDLDWIDLEGDVRAIADLVSVEKIVATAYDDLFLGSDDADVLDTGDGNDTLVGRAGDDVLIGGHGKQDVVDYSQETGTSTHVVPKGIIGKRAVTIDGVLVDLTGTALPDAPGAGIARDTHGDTDLLLGIEVVIGTARRDVLIGSLEGSALMGGAGNDILIEFSGSNLLSGGAGNDRISGGTGVDQIFGGAGRDILAGGEGNDRLDGGTGIDKMTGGLGDDVYIVDLLRDRVIEKADEGTDEVAASVNYTLGDNVEVLRLIGEKTLKGTGNGLDNTLHGNDGDNVLDGKAGVDRLYGWDGDDILIDLTGEDRLAGGDGDDTYRIGAVASQIIEGDDAGTDTVETSGSYTLGLNVENVTLTGSGDTDAIGNHVDNLLTGNAGHNLLDGRDGDDVLAGGAGDDRLMGGDGDDRLDGGTGNDIMTGGLGRDVFVFSGAFGTDEIHDFVFDSDLIDLTGLRAINGGAALTFDQLLIDSSEDTFTIRLDLDSDDVADTLDLDGDGNTDTASITLREMPPLFMIAADFVF
ncbi:MAG: hypothetical protein KDK24_00985 [Pseudooceanicola sp.]|nr:hypothetical protein [Pseudooceanicola sp.]